MKVVSLALAYILLFNEAFACSLAIDSIDWFDHTMNDFEVSIAHTTNFGSDESEVQYEKESNPSIDNTSSSQVVSGGPGQTEIVGSTANSGGGLVNTFSGDLNYSLPIMSVEGFPITLSYDPNIGMDQEASWVGLGWNLSLGAINREMRGIPDDFSGDLVERVVKSKTNTVLGESASLNIFGGLGNPVVLNKSGVKTKTGGKTKQEIGKIIPSISGGISFSRGSYVNNYTGIGLTRSFGLQGNVGVDLSLGNDHFKASMGANIGGGLGFSSDSQNGRGVSKSRSFNASSSIGNGNDGGSFGGGYNASKSTNTNSRNGIKTVNKSSGFNIGIEYSGNSNMSGGYSSSRGSMRTYGAQTFVPRFASSNKGTSYYNSLGFNATYQMGTYFVGAGGAENMNTSANRMLKFSTYYPAFGYQNTSKGQANTKAMLDFNRGQTNAASSETKILAFSVQTYDNYFCSAPGISAAYRPYRYDVLEYHDPLVLSRSENSGDVTELNVNFGTIIPAGSTVGVTAADQVVSGSSLNGSSGAIGTGNFRGVKANEPYNHKEYYLKTQGEVKPNDLSLFDEYQSNIPSLLDITTTTNTNRVTLTGTLSDKAQNGNTIPLPSQNVNLNRSKNSVHYREYPISELTAPNIISSIALTNNVPEVPTAGNQNFFTNEKKAHHTGGIEVVDQDGMRYVFGIPVYNYSQSEVAFSASTRLDEIDYNRTSLIQYENGDNSVNNNLGRAAAFEKTTIPAYASSYLLTEMLTSDYIDRTGDGVSVDDQGNFYKLNYVNPYEGDGNKEDIWKWRMPICSDLTTAPSGLGFEYEKNKAFGSKNSHTDKWDDMANYIYGEKEVWYAGTVESKNLIAFFYLEDRKDQFSAKNEDGGLDLTKPGKLLKKILLFSKNDLETNPTNAKALQIVEFEYDYSLCKKYVGNENTYSGSLEESGKLTLKRIYTYTGSSKENKTTPLEFEYDTDNPDFAFNSSDRWGNYKPNDPAIPNHEFPYAVQDNSAQTSINSWKLMAIAAIGGSRTEFSYESDDYGFVQDQRAMRMFNVIGMSSTAELQNVSDFTSGSIITESNNLANINNGNHIYLRDPGNKKNHYNVMYFKFETPIPTTISNLPAEVKAQYFRNDEGNIPDEIYFNLYSKLDNHFETSTELENGYEYVESSIKLGKLYNNGNFCGVAGLAENGQYNYGYVIIEPENINDFKDKSSNKFIYAFESGLSIFLNLLGINTTYKVSPLQVANWQYSRLNAPCNVYGDINYSATVPTEFCDYHLENDGNIFGSNIYKRFNKKKYGLQFDPMKSVMRLFEPDNIKLGGSCRITSVKVFDQWGSYSGEDNTSYTYNYDYGMRVGSSTGVASYEPQVGNNENPFYQFTTYDYKRNLLPDERVYQKDPWGELAFPGASVGYSKVISGLFNGSVVGETEEEFYTLYDVPTIAKRTQIKRIIHAGDGAIKEDEYAKEIYGFSQGFYVETSDFHGKPKRSKTIGKSGELISTSEVEYYNFNTETLSYLDNKGAVIQSETPTDVDIHADSWRNRSRSSNQTNGNTVSLGVNLYTIPIPPFVLPVPIIGFKKSEIFFQYEMEATAYTFNKVVHKYAVPKAIHTSYLGSKNTARNLYFDEATGDVIVSSLKDEFNDELYSMSYPSHWYYDEFKNMSVTDGAVVSSGIIGMAPSMIKVNGVQLHAGDVLVIDDGSSTIKAWVLEIEKQIDPDLPCVQVDVYHLIKENGETFNGINWATASFKIERTGVKNILGASMMSLVTKKFPAQSGSDFVFPMADVLSSSALTLKENENVPCIPFGDEANAQNYPSAQLPTGTIINPFLQGVRGNLRMRSSFSLQEGRDESDINTIRQNATIENYEPFYAFTECNWKMISESGHPDNTNIGGFNNWRQLGEVDKHDEFGKPLQSTDQIEVSSAAVYGMNKDLKLVQKATAVNAKSNEIGFDGFEEYEYFQNDLINYNGYGFSLEPPTGGVITSDKRHSGRYSLKITSPISYDFRAETLTTQSNHIVDHEYEVQDCDCIQGFALTPGEKYFLSTWVHENTRIYPFIGTGITVKFLDATGATLSSEVFNPSGAVIDGWQKIEGSYTFPSNAVSLQITLGTSGESYFDDFRIHPFLAGMTTTVYDQTNLLPIAHHDGYNYTTFYNYDENLQLVRVRLETIEGIKTISESEMGSYRKQQ